MSFVQKTSATVDNTTGLGTCQLTGVAANNSLALLISMGGGGAGAAGNAAPSPPTDTGGSGWQLAVGPVSVKGAGAPTTQAAIYYKLGASAGTHSLSMTLPAGTFCHWTFVEFPVASALDVTTSNSGTTSVTTGNTGTTGSTTQASEAILVALSAEALSGLPAAAFSDPPTTYTSLSAEQVTNAHEGAEHAYKEVAATGTQSATWTWTSGAEDVWMGVIATFKLGAGGATDQPPSQISYPEDMGVYEATDDPAPFDFYTDTTANRADVQPPIPVELPQSYEWVDPNETEEALWPDYWAQAPPIPDFVPDFIRPTDSSDQPEDFDEDFAFSSAPLPADVVVAIDQIQSYDADEQFEEPDEDFGFADAQVPDDIVDQLFNNFDGYFGEDDELEGFADTPQDTGAAAPADMPFTEDSDGQLEADDEPFGFSDAPLPEDAPMLAIVEDSEQEEEDEFAEGFADAPLSDDAAVDQVVVEDGTFQPPDPEDEDFATFDAPLADDVFDLNIVWPETSDNQIDTPDDEDFSFSLGPTPDDVIPPPPTNPTVDDGGWNFEHVGLGPFVRKIFATRLPLASREAVQIVGAQAELPLRHDAQAPAVFAEREHDANSLKPIVLQLMRTTYLPLSGGST